MIFDRTASDIEKAKNIRELKVKNFQALTEDEEKIIERGMATKNTLNRIEEKCEQLSKRLVSMWYFGANVNVKSWDFNQIFNIEDFRRILENLEILKHSFFVKKKTQKTPLPNFNFEVFNDIEKILYDIEDETDFIKKNSKRCGTINCGG